MGWWRMRQNRRACNGQDLFVVQYIHWVILIFFLFNFASQPTYSSTVQHVPIVDWLPTFFFHISRPVFLFIFMLLFFCFLSKRFLVRFITLLCLIYFHFRKLLAWGIKGEDLNNPRLDHADYRYAQLYETEKQSRNRRKSFRSIAWTKSTDSFSRSFSLVNWQQFTSKQ